MGGKAKPVSASRLVLAELMTPRDANVYGNVRGSTIMRLADTAAAVVAVRASPNRVGRISMEVGVRVEAEELRTGRKTHTNPCDFTMVALDARGRPVPGPRVIPETEEDRRRCEAAGKPAAAQRGRQGT